MWRREMQVPEARKRVRSVQVVMVGLSWAVERAARPADFVSPSAQGAKKDVYLRDQQCEQRIVAHTFKGSPEL